MLLLRATAVFCCVALGARASAAASTSPPYPNAAQIYGDVECLAVGLHMGTSKIPKVRSAATIEVAYYLGRINAQDENFNLSQGLKNILVMMTPQSTRAAALRCGAAMEKSGRELEALKAILPPRINPG